MRLNPLGSLRFSGFHHFSTRCLDDGAKQRFLEELEAINPDGQRVSPSMIRRGQTDRDDYVLSVVEADPELDESLQHIGRCMTLAQPAVGYSFLPDDSPEVLKYRAVRDFLEDVGL